MSLDNLDFIIKGINSATDTLKGVVHATPLERSTRLSQICGTDIYLKREDLQLCRSFKVRGAFNKIANLSPEEKRKGVICASAGNHAQGVAYACATMQINGVIYLPVSTPKQKQDRIKSLGQDWVKLELIDDIFDGVQKQALDKSALSGKTYVHPYDDLDVIVGQGSLAQEITEQMADNIANVIIPVGGGGLISGIAPWFKKHFPNIRIVGVESEGAASAHASLMHGEPYTLSKIDRFVDGTAVARIGDKTFEIIDKFVDLIVTVPEGAVAAEILDLYHKEGIIAEPAGALATAALILSAKSKIEELVLDGPTIALISGGNNDLSRYAEIQERSLVYLGLRHYFLVSFPQKPRALYQFLTEILSEDDDIIHFEYTKKNNRETGPALVGIDIAKEDNLEPLLDRIAHSSLHIEHIDPEHDLMSFII